MLASSVPVSAARRPVAGIQLYTVNEELSKDPAGTLAKIAQIGYREVEAALFGKIDITEFRKQVSGAGLRCPSAHLVFGMADTDKLLDSAKALGVHYAVSSVLLPGAPPPGWESDFSVIVKVLNTLTVDDFKRVAERANQIAEKAHAAGLQYAYHNHNFEFRDLGGGEIGYTTLLKETDPKLVKFELDCGWMVTGGGDPVQYFKRYPGRFRMIHVKDFPNSTKTTTDLGQAHPTELGRGHINYKRIVPAALKAGVEHLFVEQDPPIADMTPLEAAKVGFVYLNGLLNPKGS